MGEVRQSTRRLEEQYDGLQSDMTSMRSEMKSMRDDIRALDHKIDKRTEFLERENERLKKLLGQKELENAILKDLLEKGASH